MATEKEPAGQGADGLKDRLPGREAIFASNQDFLDAMIEGYQVLDFSWRYLYLNEAALRHSGKTREELLGRRMMEVYPGIEDTELFARLEACMRERRPASLENEFTYPDGSRRSFELRLLPVAAGLSVLSLDLTEGRRRTRILSELASASNSALTAEDVFHAALGAIGALSSYPLGHVYLPEPQVEGGPLLLPSGFWQCGEESRFARFRARTGETELAPGEPLAGLVYSSRAPVWIEDLGACPGFRRAEEALQAGLRTAVGFPVLSRGEVLAVLELFSPEREEAPEALESLFEPVEAQIRTALERIGAEARLRRLSAVVEQSPIAVLISDLRGLISYVNPELSRMTGFPREELLGRSVEQIRDRIAERGLATKASRAAFSGQAWNGEFSSRRKDGSLYWEKVSIIPIKDGAGRLDSIVSLREEITEAKLREDAIREEERSARLVKGVALAANRGAELETLLGTALASVAEYAAWPLAHAYLPRRADGAGLRLIPSSVWYRARDRGFEGFMEATMAKPLLPGQGMAGRAYLSREPLWIRVGEEEATFLRGESARTAGIVAGLALPVALGDSVYALLEFFSTREMRPEPRLLDHLGQVCSTLGVALARREAEEKLKRLSEIVEQSPTGVVTLDDEGLIEYVNARFAEMTGYATGELLGRRGEVLGEGIEDRELFRGITEAMTAGRTWRGELLNTRKDGTRFWERAAIFPVRDAQGRLLSFVTLADDVTELKKIEEELRLAKTEAERANKAKSDFLAAMSHEIRTPMNAVIGLTNLALKSELEPQVRDYILKIRRSSQLLLDIINEVLDFSRIEAGRIELESLSFDLERSLQSLWTVVSLRAAEKELSMAMRLAPELPRLLVGDPHRLGQVILNLLNNAVKFTPRGEVLLSISLLKREEGRAWLRFSVRDTGIGMSPEQLARIFKPYGQAEGGTSRKFGGSGLGLVISERLVSLMGGRMMVASEPGRGSEFSLNLPFGLPATEEAESPAPPPEWRRLRALVVDDSAEDRESLRSLLEALSFRVAVASSAEEARVLLRPGPGSFDLALLDSRLGEGSGLELLAELRATEGLEGLPIVILGAEGERESLREELEARGASGFLAKPTSPSILLDLILGLVTTIREPEREGLEEGASARRESLRGLRILLAEDNEINQEVALGILAAQGAVTEVAEDGFAVLDRLAAKDYDAILMDLQMPRMGGLAATGHIRADPALKDSLVIAMTADVFALDEAGHRAADFDACLFKPVDEAKLLDTLERLIQARRARGIAPASRGWEGSSPSPGPRPGAEAGTGEPAGGLAGARVGGGAELAPIPGFDLEAGLGRLLGKREGYRALLFKYAEGQAEAAAEIARSLDRGEEEGARALAHALKGMSANLGARELPALLAELEAALREGRAEEARALAARGLKLHEASLAAIRGWRARVEAAAGLPGSGGTEEGGPGPRGGEAGGAPGPAACRELGELVARLEGSDAEARESLGAVKRQVPSPSAALEERLARLEAEIGEYDFEEALRGAAALERELGCAVGN